MISTKVQFHEVKSYLSGARGMPVGRTPSPCPKVGPSVLNHIFLAP